MPYDAGGSKNRRAILKDGKLIVSGGYKAFTDAVYLSLVDQRNRTGVVFARRRLSLSIVLRVPNRARRDAANLVDAVCDAAAKAIGVDDVFFDGSWKTELAPGSPSVEVSLCQDKN